MLYLQYKPGIGVSVPGFLHPVNNIAKPSEFEASTREAENAMSLQATTAKELCLQSSALKFSSQRVSMQQLFHPPAYIFCYFYMEKQPL